MENELIVFQLNQRRFSLDFAHCWGWMWEEQLRPGLVSVDRGGSNLIRGVSPGQAFPPASLQL